MGDSQATFWQVNFQDRWQNNVGAGGTTLPEAAAQNRFREDEFIFDWTRLRASFGVKLCRSGSEMHPNESPSENLRRFEREHANCTGGHRSDAADPR
jgi:hypothetical protein